MANKLIANHSIGRVRPGATGLLLKGYNPNTGEPEMRVDTEYLQPGDIFDETRADVLAGILCGEYPAARYLTDDEQRSIDAGAQIAAQHELSGPAYREIKDGSK